MILPNKSIRIETSLLYQSIELFDEIKTGEEVNEFFMRISKKDIGIDEVIIMLDLLFLLEKIEINFELGTLKKCL